jgi:predicted alpha/beta hydrolase
LDMEKVEIKSGDGVTSRITLFRANNLDATVIMCMPAMGVWASYYEPLARVLTLSGRNVITADLRGNGESQIRPRRSCDFGYYEMVHYDWPAVVAETKRLFPRSPKVILGHSLGGQLSTLYMSTRPGEIDGLILVACPSVHYRGWPFTYGVRLILMTQTFRLISEILGYFPGKRVGFAGTEAKTHIKDWAHTTLTGRYEPKNAKQNYEELLPSLDAPILAISFTDDPLAQKEAVQRLLSKFPRAQIIHWHLAPQEIGLDSLGHVAWVKKSEPLVEKMSGWLKQVIISRHSFDP